MYQTKSSAIAARNGALSRRARASIIVWIRALFSAGVIAAPFLREQLRLLRLRAWFRSRAKFAIVCAPSLHADRGQVLEPVLGLHELLDPWRECVRVGVVHHPHQRSIVDDQGV